MPKHQTTKMSEKAITENISRIWIDLNRKSFLIEVAKNDSFFDSETLLFVTIANAVFYISRNRSSVIGYKVVGIHAEVLDIASVISLREQLKEHRECLKISEKAGETINDLLNDLIDRLKANELWNSRFIAGSDKNVLDETSIKWRWETLQFNIIKQWIEKVDKRIIDAPSGSGRFSIAVARQFPESQVLAIDLLPKALNLAKRGAKIQNITNIKFQQADILALPQILRYQPKFDVAISIGLVQNLTEDNLRVLIKALIQIVRPGGKVIISVPNGNSPIYRLWKFVVGENLKYRFGLERNVKPHEIINLFKEQHLDEIEIEGADPLYGLRKMYHVDANTGKAIPFGWSKYSRVLGQFLDYYFIDPVNQLTKGWLSRQIGNDFIVKGKMSSLSTDTPIGVCLVSSEIKSGSLRNPVEDQYEAIKGLQTEDGKKLISYQRLATKYDLEFQLTSRGELFKIRFFPQEQEERSNSWPLLRFSLSDNINQTFDVYARQKIYSDKHLILGVSGKSDVIQSMYLDGLKAGFRFLKGMGAGYFGFFNAATPTTNSFHYQFFGDLNDQWPIWQNIDRGLVTIEEERLYGIDDVLVGNLVGWPITAPVFQSRNPESLANAIWKEINPKKLSENTISDLIFTHSPDGQLKVILILRDKAEAMKKPTAFYPSDIDSYGTFGCMEFAGIILMEWKDEIYQSLKDNMELTAERVKKAFKETTIPFII